MPFERCWQAIWRPFSVQRAQLPPRRQKTRFCEDPQKVTFERWRPFSAQRAQLPIGLPWPPIPSAKNPLKIVKNAGM